MTDTSDPIEVAIGRALRMLREIDAISSTELELMREDGLVDEPMYREIMGRTGPSDFLALVAAVRDQVPAATEQEIDEALAKVAAAELAEGDTEPVSIVKLLKNAPGIH
jgi:hypothetical protein